MDPDRETGRGFLLEPNSRANYETRERRERAAGRGGGEQPTAETTNGANGTNGDARSPAMNWFMLDLSRAIRVIRSFARSSILFGCFPRFRYGFRP